jgi:hypothetical protein
MIRQSQVASWYPSAKINGRVLTNIVLSVGISEFIIHYNIYLNAERGGGGRIAVYNMPLLVNQELRKVPLDTVPKETTFAWLEKLVNWCSIIAIHIHLKIKRRSESSTLQLRKSTSCSYSMFSSRALSLFMSHVQ